MKKVRERTKGFKKGAASFYIVAIATLILMVLAVSFATVIMSGIERTSNDDLSQSAYDSAMAGVEDAKLAFYNYRTCKAKNNTSSGQCGAIIAAMEAKKDDDTKYNCGMVGRMVGRLDMNPDGTGMDDEVKIEDTVNNYEVGNNMQQAYTCTKIDTVLSDYRSTLSATNMTRVIKPNLVNPNGGSVSADKIDRVKISWYLGTEALNWTNFYNGKVAFPAIGENETAVPPTISVALVQTAKTFNMEDFETVTEDGQTDRGMIYLVPAEKGTVGVASRDEKAFGAYRTGTYNNALKADVIPAEAFVKSNNHETKNLPYVVNCGKGDDGFECSAILELPKPVPDENGHTERNNDTFMFVVSLPYGRPTTDFAFEFLCKDGEDCGNGTDGNGSDDEQEAYNTVYMSGAQVKIDSTGRANDLFRRVEVRMEASADSSYVSLLGALEVYEDGSGPGAAGSVFGLEKDYTVLNDFKRTLLIHDTVILIDTTGSMSGMIAGAKNEVVNIARETFGINGGRMALYEYRDAYVDSGYQSPVRICDFQTCKEDELNGLLSRVSVGGGGDYPESALSGALDVMNELDWRKGAMKAIVIITDATFLNPDYGNVTPSDVIARSKAIAQEKGDGQPVHIYVVTNGSAASAYQQLVSETGGEIVTQLGQLKILTE